MVSGVVLVGHGGVSAARDSCRGRRAAQVHCANRGGGVTGKREGRAPARKIWIIEVMDLEPWKQPEIVAHSSLLSDSHRYWTGRPLWPHQLTGEALARALYQAPFVLLSHGTEAEPLFHYANLAAQRLWGRDWQEFVGSPSRLSAEPQVRADRSAASP